MSFELPPLRYPLVALEPWISRRALELHCHKHHAGYADKLNQPVAGTPLAGLELEKVIRRTAADPAHRRVDYVKAFLDHLVDWRHAEAALERRAD